MKLKKLLVTICAVAIAMSSFAQLSTRSNDPSTFAFGTRPVAGDYGLNFQFYNGTGNTNFKNYFNKMPIINMQYYLDSDLALRFGIRASKEKTLFKGESDTTNLKNNGIDFNNDGTADGMVTELKYKYSTREYMIYLGLEKHFSPTNILDVYVGGQIPLGFSSEVEQMNYDGKDLTYTDTEKYYALSRTNSIVYGIEFFFGLQAFVADLPIALGIEWGIAGYGRLNNKTYNKIEQNGQPTQEFYTAGVGTANSNFNPGATQFTKLNSRRFDMDDMFRFRVSYYFAR